MNMCVPFCRELGIGLMDGRYCDGICTGKMNVFIFTAWGFCQLLFLVRSRR